MSEKVVEYDAEKGACSSLPAIDHRRNSGQDSIARRCGEGTENKPLKPNPGSIINESSEISTAY